MIPGPGQFDSCQEIEESDSQGIAKTKANVHGWRSVIVLQLAYVGAVKPSRKKQAALELVWIPDELFTIRLKATCQEGKSRLIAGLL